MDKEKTLIFDFFGVICSEIFEIWMVKHNLGDKREEIKSITHAADFGEIDENEEMRRLAEFSGQSVEGIIAEWKEITGINEGLLKKIEELHEEYNIILLSNATKTFLDKMFQEYALGKYFDKVFVSSEIGMRKPDPEIFRYVLRQIGKPAKSCTMIDDRKKNVEAAKSVGMNAILYK